MSVSTTGACTYPPGSGLAALDYTYSYSGAAGMVACQHAGFNRSGAAIILHYRVGINPCFAQKFDNVFTLFIITCNAGQCDFST